MSDMDPEVDDVVGDFAAVYTGQDIYKGCSDESVVKSDNDGSESGSDNSDCGSDSSQSDSSSGSKSDKEEKSIESQKPKKKFNTTIDQYIKEKGLYVSSDEENFNDNDNQNKVGEDIENHHDDSKKLCYCNREARK